MAYPTVFINASCDFTATRLVKIPFKEYIEHIYYCVDNRVSTHPFLKFFLMNLQLRMQALYQSLGRTLEMKMNQCLERS